MLAHTTSCLSRRVEVGQLGRFQVSPPSLDRSWIGLECGVFGNYFESGVCHFRGVP